MWGSERKLIKGGVDSDRWVREGFPEEVVPQLGDVMVIEKWSGGDHCKLREQDRKNGSHRAILLNHAYTRRKQNGQDHSSEVRKT